MSKVLLDRKQIIFFAGKKMLLEEFLIAYDLQDEADSVSLIVIEKLIKKGKLRFIENEQNADNAFKAVNKELELDAKIAQIEEDAVKYDEYQANKSKEGKLVYEEIEIDFPTFKNAQEMLSYCTNKLRLKGHVKESEDIYAVVLQDVSESNLSAIKRYDLFNKAGKLMLDSTNRVSTSALDTVAFAADKIVLPTAKAGISTTLGLARTIVKTGASAGSAVISGTTKNVRTMSKELSEDEDVLRAKKDLIDAKDAVMRLFKRGSKSDSIRITK